MPRRLCTDRGEVARGGDVVSSVHVLRLGASRFESLAEMIQLAGALGCARKLLANRGRRICSRTKILPAARCQRDSFSTMQCDTGTKRCRYMPTGRRGLRKWPCAADEGIGH